MPLTRTPVDTTGAPGGEETAAAPADSLVPPDALPLPPDSLRSGAPLPDTTSAGDSTAAVGEGVLSAGPWNLDGDNLRAESGPSGQIIRIERPVITHDEVRITAAQGRYEVEEGLAYLDGDVHFLEPGLVGESDHAVYERETGILTAEGNVAVETDSLQVTGDSGIFDRDANRFLLRGNVDGWRGSRHMEAREAEWFRDRGEILLRENVVVTSEDGTVLTGEEVLYDVARDEAVVRSTPRLVLESRDGNILVSGDRMWVDPAGNARTVGNVHVIQGGILATADSAVYMRDESRAVLSGAPMVRERDGTLTGDLLTLYFDENQAINLVTMVGRAHVRFAPTDSLKQGEVSTVAGDSLTMHFDEEGATDVVVVGNAESTYRPSPEDLSSGVGTNLVEGDTITIFLDEGEVDRVKVAGNARGVYAFVERTPEDDEKGEDGGAETGEEAGPGGSAAPDTAGIGPAGEGVPALPDSTGILPLERAEEAAPSEGKVIYHAHEVVFFVEEREVSLQDEVKLDYGTLTLTAGKVRFYAERRYLDAQDDPVLVERNASEGERQVVGQEMDYNLDSKEGSIQSGLTKTEDGFVYAERLKKIGDDELLAKKGNFTSCDLVDEGERPHYHFTSNKMRVYLDDKAVARPVVLYIRDIPILAVPFYVFSLRKGRQSGLLTFNFSPGVAGSRAFINNFGYYWAASEYYDFTFSMDYADNPSWWVGRFNTAFKKRGLLDGFLNAATTLGTGTRQHDVVGAFNMSYADWRVTSRAEFRDATFRSEEPLTGDFGSRLDRQLTNDLSLARTFSDINANLTLSLNQRKDLDIGPEDPGVVLTQTLPRYTFSLNSRPIGHEPDELGQGGRLPFLSNLRFSFRSSGSSAKSVQNVRTITPADSTAPADTSVAEVTDRLTGARHVFDLTDTRRILNALNLAPSFTLNESWVDRVYSPTDTVKGFHRAATWSLSLNANTALYGTLPGVGPIQSLRHTVRPGATLSYSPEFRSLAYIDSSGVRRNRFPGVSASPVKLLSLSLDNNFQGKVEGEEGTRTVDLLHWTLGTGYNLDADPGEPAWGRVSSAVNLRTLGVGLNFTSQHDPYEKFRFDNFQLTAAYSISGRLPGGSAAPEPAASTAAEEALPGEGEGEEADWIGKGIDPNTSRGLSRAAGSGGDLGWNAGFTLSYAGNRETDDFPTNASLNASLSVELTRNWNVSYSTRWDITNGETLGDNLSLSRQLHCWQAQFNRSTLVGGGTQFWFQLSINALPDLKYEQGEQTQTGLGDLKNLLP